MNKHSGQASTPLLPETQHHHRATAVKAEAINLARTCLPIVHCTARPATGADMSEF